MAAPKRREAALISWRSPQDQACSLRPMAERNGYLEAEIREGYVEMHGRNCRHKAIPRGGGQTGKETVFGEFEITIPVNVCQIVWKVTKEIEPEDETRSAYFQH